MQQSHDGIIRFCVYVWYYEERGRYMRRFCFLNGLYFERCYELRAEASLKPLKGLYEEISQCAGIHLWSIIFMDSFCKDAWLDLSRMHTAINACTLWQRKSICEFHVTSREALVFLGIRTVTFINNEKFDHDSTGFNRLFSDFREKPKIMLLFS